MSKEAGNKVNIKEIAEVLGISPTTVSRTLSGKGRVGEETKKKILDYIQENEYEPNVRQKNYADHKTYNICVALPGEDDFAELPYFQKILLSIYDYFEARDYNVIFVKLKAVDITPIVKVVNKHKIDGVILTRSIEENPAVKYLQEQGVPFVVVGSYDDDTVYQVDVDQENGCRELTSILIQKGMRKIALFCGDLKHVVTKHRYKGYMRACQESNLPIDKNLIFDQMGNEAVADKVIEEMLKEQVECFLCMDDYICINVLRKLRRENVSIPRDVKVASFYNSAMLSSNSPAITCLEFDTKELGTIASKMLLDILEGNSTSRKIMLGYQVILKNSTK